MKQNPSVELFATHQVKISMGYYSMKEHVRKVSPSEPSTVQSTKTPRPLVALYGLVEEPEAF